LSHRDVSADDAAPSWDLVRLLVVSSDPLARAGLAALLDQEPRCAVIGQVPATPQVADAAAVYHPDALIWDLGWDVAEHGQAALEWLGDLADAGCAVVVLLSDTIFAGAARHAGALGILPRNVNLETLVAATLAVTCGLVVWDPSVATMTLPIQHPSSDLLAEPLTPRELEVLQSLVDGATNRAIAQRLGISEHTIKFHVNAILAKLGAQSRTEAVVRGIRLGLILI